MAHATYTRAFYEGFEDVARSSSRVVADLVNVLVHPTSVIDVGCGAGLWLASFRERGASDILGVDGAYVDPDQLKIPRDRFQAADLSVPLTIARRFDLAVSVEVAEHLPASRAKGFVADLTKLAPIVLFSAAIPFQGGNDHQNEQWQDYWAELFGGNDFLAIDCVRRKVWSDPRVAWYYAQNVVLYARRDRVESDASLRAEYEAARGWPLRVVHPQKYLSTADITGIPLRRAVGWLPTLAYHGLRRTFASFHRVQRQPPRQG